ncbi:hypothetical protein JOB18_043712 [Solea senegalensis]|uniref:Uncharacterized protein n=1 Tax=Solea senegalensis TaxID=28829 RepID=A0AAV6SQX7_SOLSE|nr:hypothetical protein JOB18_043712 [Solea senegalensis]
MAGEWTLHWPQSDHSFLSSSHEVTGATAVSSHRTAYTGAVVPLSHGLQTSAREQQQTQECRAEVTVPRTADKL